MSIDSSLIINEKEKKGSIEFQICHLTERIERLTLHLQKHSKDFSSRKGLYKIVRRRKCLLVYLTKNNFIFYEKLISQLGIRRLKTP
uniref:Small ribosomal subunit protein uS15c n=1 Tax=Tmesipteris elongata TaxID=50272 RepID=A0A059U7G2_TMEEL|nr:ribosomal protein S15 [Tmesipteris elongata]